MITCWANMCAYWSLSMWLRCWLAQQGIISTVVPRITGSCQVLRLMRLFCPRSLWTFLEYRYFWGEPWDFLPPSQTWRYIRHYCRWSDPRLQQQFILWPKSPSSILYRLFLSIRKTRSVAGHMLEPAAEQFLGDGGTFEVILLEGSFAHTLFHWKTSELLSEKVTKHQSRHVRLNLFQPVYKTTITSLTLQPLTFSIFSLNRSYVFLVIK